MTNSSRIFFCSLLDTITEDRLKSLIRQILLYPGSIEELDIDRLLGSDSQEEISRPSLTFRDYRLLDIRMLNVRLFPFDRAIPYGLDFTNNSGEACSAFIVGNNGFGKSSVYGALEYLYTDDCSYARRIGRVPVDYLMNLFVDKMPEQHRAVNIVGKTSSQIYLQSAEHRPVGIPAAFTSDYNIEELEREDDNLYAYVLKGMGYEEILVLLRQKLRPKISEKQNRYRKILNYIQSDDVELNATDYQHIKRELIQLSELEDKDKLAFLLRFTNSKEVDGIINSLKRGDSPMDIAEELFPEEWTYLRSNMQLTGSVDAGQRHRRWRITGEDDILSRDEVSLSIRRIKALYRKLGEYYQMLGTTGERHDVYYRLKVVEVVERLDREYEERDKQRDVTEPVDERERLQQELEVLIELERMMTQGISAVLQSYYNTFGPFIEETMTAFSFHGGYDEKFRMMIGDGILRLKLELKDAHGDSPLVEVSPRAYFNTFRFKLYALAFRLTLAFAYMKENNVLIPIVIDDVFSASDFENGLKIEQFVYNIYKVYRETLGFHQSLQLIMLTHDEMILNSFRRGIKLKYADDMNRSNEYIEQSDDYFVCGRLYPYWKSKELSQYSKSGLGFYNIFFHYSILKDEKD